MNRRGFLGSIGKGLAALGITVTTPAVAKAMVEERVIVIPKDATNVRVMTLKQGEVFSQLSDDTAVNPRWVLQHVGPGQGEDGPNKAYKWTTAYLEPSFLRKDILDYLEGGGILIMSARQVRQTKRSRKEGTTK